MKRLLLIPLGATILCSLPAVYAQNVELIGIYDAIENARDVFVSGDYAYVADRDFGLQIVDVSDPANPASAGSYDMPDFARSVFVSGDYAFVTWTGMYGYPGGLVIIDIFDPYNPALAGSYDALFYAYDDFVSGDYAYVAGASNRWSGALQIVNISDPANPVLAGSYSPCGGGTRVFVSGDYAYLGGSDCEGGDPFLDIVDVSNPTDPTLAGWIPAYNRGVFVTGNYLYSAGWWSLMIFDVSDPANAFFTGSYDRPGEGWSVFVSGDYAYVADGDSGLLIIDVSDPYNPAFAGSYDTPGVAREVFVSGDYIYAADTYSLIILRFNPLTGVEERERLPARFSLEQNYPNPFNASTRIDFDLPALSNINISVYDILGRRVSTLFEGQKQPGHHSLIWNAADFHSGIYFARLRSGSMTDVVRMTLLK